MTTAEVRRLAQDCGFELAGVAAAVPNADAQRYREWAERGLAGAMSYLTDRRATVRDDPRNLLPSARSIICVGKLYNTRHPYSTDSTDDESVRISRYAWGDDYHDVLHRGLEKLVLRMREQAEFEHKICVDTAPLLERSYARDAGLGWIGRNTCLINQYAGSWFFLGELIVSLDLERDRPVPSRCGTCTQCVDACPTQAILPRPDGSFELDARSCISYLTIELKGPVPEELRAGVGRNVFGCDICQDVCPWNARAAMTLEPGFEPRDVLALDELAALTEDDFRHMFRGSPVHRTKYSGFLRNVAVAMGNTRSPKFREPLQRLAEHPMAVVAEHARHALQQLD